ncbi:AraC family transcriptional regulator [Solidesulfovibrio sp. C21]|uniref:AraC family transcriptional regulator n=1 Tax=Solidesulfovibrio sp. C21 TaxID=3398613 RepID=UPI0039FD9A9D
MDALCVDSSERLDGPPLIVLSGDDQPGCEYRLGTREYAWHNHERGQLFCVHDGLMQVSTKHGSWVLPPLRAGWIPPKTEHKIKISGAISGWSILILPQICSDILDFPCVINISKLMDALIKRIVSWGPRDVLDEYQERILAILLDEIKRSPNEPLHLPIPSDPRLSRITEEFITHPEEKRTLEEWGAWAGVSPRTLGRLFIAETGLTFTQWRQQARLTHALEMLAQGESVGAVADALGYATPSVAFSKKYDNIF